jgi:hypothetical protein
MAGAGFGYKKYFSGLTNLPEKIIFASTKICYTIYILTTGSCAKLIFYFLINAIMAIWI